MAEQEHTEESTEEREETLKDLDVPEEESGAVTGGLAVKVAPDKI